jgi:mannose-6-phosphate isomerase-like protein (cupin superfamily)
MRDKSKPEFYTDERCYITELLNDARYPQVSLARCRVKPGVTTQLHALAVHEFYVLQSGTGLMRIGDKAPFDVGEGDTVSIPKGIAQNVTNTGDGDLVFLCVCAPRFSQDCYTSLE